ncbi:class II aldolase/adducin family protein [Abyssisolibacter fermentans]|uniref:class II aldolase/adducin family protein n=1 Tax=Abyssisolibacter fermentans TaxID=1766203 RepID=UPI0008328B59|nr:class II aldolase/adducin family protein [Abyssisolibacter fermentans]
MMLEEQRKKVIEIALSVQKENLVPLTFGNFSLRDEETGYICITPSGMPYESLKPEDIVVLDVDCNKIDGSRKPSIEAPLHCTAYRKREDVGGIVHTHSTYCTAWACAGIEMPCVTAEAAALVGGKIKCAPFRPMGTVDLAEVTIEWLGQDSAVLMEKHGVFAVGENIDQAFVNAVIVEESAKVTHLASQLGELKPLDEEMCKFLQADTKANYGQ